MTGRLLIAGCGDVGVATGLRLAAAGWSVHGLRRRAGGLPAPIRPVTADLLDRRSLSAAGGDWDCIVYCPAPGERTADAYRDVFVRGLENLLAVAASRRLLYVSSTAVYGQRAGEPVDETSPTEPGGFNGRVLLEGEALARAGTSPAVVVRFGGIYGPGRERLLRMAARGAAGEVVCEPPQWTNRIHRDDCAGVLAWLSTAPDPAPCINGVDDAPTPLHEVLAWLAGRLGVEGPSLVRDSGADAGKRVSNRRLRQAGYRFTYPDFRSGYGALLDAAAGPAPGALLAGGNGS